MLNEKESQIKTITEKLEDIAPSIYLVGSFLLYRMKLVDLELVDDIDYRVDNNIDEKTEEKLKEFADENNIEYSKKIFNENICLTFKTDFCIITIKNKSSLLFSRNPFEETILYKLSRKHEKDLLQLEQVIANLNKSRVN